MTAGSGRKSGPRPPAWTAAARTWTLFLTRHTGEPRGCTTRSEAESAADRLRDVVGVDAELSEEITMLLMIDLVGQLVGRLLMISATLLDLREHRLLVELHNRSFRIVPCGAY